VTVKRVQAPLHLNLTQHCLAGKPADKTALIVVDAARPHRWSYGALEDEVLRLAGGLRRQGVETGARLMIRMGNSLDYALTFFAANAAGAIPIPASPLLTPREVSVLLADSGASFMAWDGKLALPELAGIRLLTPDDLSRLKRTPRGDYAATHADTPAYLVYTSGTSGRPKGVLHAQRAILGRQPMYQGWSGLAADDILLHTGALNWTYTLGVGLCDPFVQAATAVVYTGPADPAVWPRLVADHNVTIIASVPGIYRQSLRAGLGRSPSLRHGLTAGESLAPSILESWRSATGCELYEALGMSEISTYISSGPSVPVRPGSPGKPQAGRKVRLLPDGEIAIHHSDPGLFLQYWGDEEATGAEWFATGDIADIDADGYVWYHGRADDLMNAGGFRVSPLEVETVLVQHPAVADAGVREWKVSDSSSIVAAFIVPQPGAGTDEASILAFVRERLAAYKCPRQIWFVPALPRTANGKLIRKALEKP
jgi:acyl-coenzyme A synthetase/AMP-(fatty) acid ligase